MTSPPRWPGWAVIGLTVLGLTATYLTAPSVFESTDFLRFHAPLHAYGANALRAGHLPLWNPYVNLGRPYLADLQSGLFYPTNLLYLLFPVRMAFFLMAAVHLTLLTIGMAFLASFLGAAAREAWAAGFIFAFAGVTSGTLQTGTIECTAALAYCPWVFLLGAKLQDKPNFRDFVTLTVALALQLLCGHPQYSWITIIGVSIFLVARRAEAPWMPNLRWMARDLACLLVSGVLAMAIDAVQLLPFLDLVKQGNRGMASLASSDAWSLSWRDWATLVRPAKSTFVVNWTYDFYPGLIVGLVGIIGFLRRRDRNRRALLIMSLVAALIAVGTRTPVFALLYEILPGVSMFRLHGRAAILVVMALCLTASLALGDVRSKRRDLGIVVAGILAAAVNLIIEFQIPVASRSWGEVAARLMMILVVVILLIHPRGSSPLLRWQFVALGILQVIDLGWATWAMKRTYVFPHQFPAEVLVKGELEKRELLGPGKAPPRISMPFPYVRENAGMIYGWSTFNGYVSLSLNRVWLYLHRVLGIEPSDTLNTIPANDIYHAGPFPYTSMNLVLGWDPLSRRGVVNPRPDPRVYLALEVALEPSWQKAINRMRAGHDFHKQALVETPTMLGPNFAGATPSRRDCTAQIRYFAAEQVQVQTECPEAALLVLAEAYHPGWEALVDGVSRPVVPANVWMRSVVLPAGHHDVVFTYRERKLATGAVISCTTLLGLAFLTLLHRRRRKSAWSTRSAPS